MSTLNEDNYNRLANLIIENNVQFQNIDFEEAYSKAISYLKGLRVQLKVDSSVKNSISKQASTVTAVNCAKRAFLGGVHVKIDKDFKCQLNGFENQNFSDVIIDLGGEVTSDLETDIVTFRIGHQAESNLEVEIVSNGWQGGIIPYDFDVNLIDEPDFSLGGSMAGSIAIGSYFLERIGLDKSGLDSPKGLSLWRPDLDWLSEEAIGPEIKFLPESLWLIGLGHLGQAYSWVASLLPYSNNSDLELMLQDFDILAEANFGSGMLSESKDVGKYKTRVTSSWLESRGFKTRISERAFGKSYEKSKNDPSILIGGLDSFETRRNMNLEFIEYYIDCGLGGSMATFDTINIYSFPACSRKPGEIWNQSNQLVHKAVANMENTEYRCGILAEKAISTAFVGVLAASLVISDLLRLYNSGISYENISVSIRELGELYCKQSTNEQVNIGKIGYCQSK